MKNKEETILFVSGSRLALQKSDEIVDWYISYSPRNDNFNAEGTWKEWVKFANKIIKRNEQLKKVGFKDLQTGSISCQR